MSEEDVPKSLLTQEELRNKLSTSSTYGRGGQNEWELSIWDDVDTYDKVQGSLDVEQKVRLIGVPFIVTSVAFRVSDSGGDFVTLEVVTAPEDKFNREAIVKFRKSNTKDLSSGMAEEMGYSHLDFVPPLTHLVFNDSSTGIRRQIVSFLEAKDLITLSNETIPLEAHDKLDGAGGSSPFDKPVSDWKDDNGAKDGIDIRLYCPKGVRLSAYESAFGPASTFYLA